MGTTPESYAVSLIATVVTAAYLPTSQLTCDWPCVVLEQPAAKCKNLLEPVWSTDVAAAEQ